LSNIALLTYPICIWISPDLWRQKITAPSCRILRGLRGDNFSRFDRTPTCDRQTDGQTHTGR